MFRIRVDAWPALEKLSVTKPAQARGAQKESFRPSFDALESRELFATNLASIYLRPPAAPPASAAYEIQMPSPGAAAGARHRAPAALAFTAAAPREWDENGSHFKEWEEGAANYREQTVIATGERILTATWDSGARRDEKQVERWYPGAGGRTFYELQIFKKATNLRTVYGREEADRYIVETWSPRGTPLATSVYDKVGAGQQLLSRVEPLPGGAKIAGKWSADGRRWEETTTGSPSFKERIEAFDQPDGRLLLRYTRENDGEESRGEHRADGRWVETETGSSQFRSRISVYDQAGGVGRPSRLAIVRRLLERDTVRNDGSSTHGELLPNGRWRVTENGATVANGAVGVNADGTVTVTEATTVRTYRLGADGRWSVASAQRFVNDAVGHSLWLEETWAANGDYVGNFWWKRDHQGLGSVDQMGQLRAQSGAMAFTMYHTGGFPIYWGLNSAPSQDATVTWRWALDAAGKVKTLQQYDVSQPNTSWAANWKNPITNRDPNYYANGWLQYAPSGNWNNVGQPPGPLTLSTGYRSAELAAFASPLPAVATPPGVTIETETANGQKTETVWSTARTQMVRFVYPAVGAQTLLEQTYGSTVGGKWVEVSDHSKQFVTQTSTFDKFGGKLETQVTRRTTADANNGVVTFSGSWVANVWTVTATGYLDYQSVTIQYQNNKATTRFGTLTNGQFATDTFNSAGTGVVKREVAATKGGPLLQTWSVDGNNLLIQRSNPAAHVTQDRFTFYINNPNYFSNVELATYDASFDKQFELIFDDGSSEMTNSYHWKYWVTKDRDGNSQDNYREWGSSGRQRNASSLQRPQWLPDGGTPDSFTALANLGGQHAYWNKV